MQNNSGKDSYQMGHRSNWEGQENQVFPLQKSSGKISKFDEDLASCEGNPVERESMHLDSASIPQGAKKSTNIDQFDDCEKVAIQENQICSMAGRMENDHLQYLHKQTHNPKPNLDEAAFPCQGSQESSQNNLVSAYENDTSAQKIFAQGPLAATAQSPANSYHPQGLERDDYENTKSEQEEIRQKDQNGNSNNLLNSASPGTKMEREKRKVRDKTISYSLTHKGLIPSNSPDHTSPFSVSEFNHQNNSNGTGISSMQKRHSRHTTAHGSSGSASRGQNQVVGDERQANSSEKTGVQIRPATDTLGLGDPSNAGGSKTKKHSGPKSAQQCFESISNMFAFDWRIKDIANLKHSPQSELNNAPLIFWFYVCSQYFPFHAIELAKQPVECFVEPILEKLKPNNKNLLQNSESKLIKYPENQQQDVIAQQQEPLHQIEEQKVNSGQLAQNDKREAAQQNDDCSSQETQMRVEEPALKAQMTEEPEQSDILPDYVKTLLMEKQMRNFKKLVKDTELQIVHLRDHQKIDTNAPQDHFDRIIDMLMTEVLAITDGNKKMVVDQFVAFKAAYERALASSNDDGILKNSDKRVISGNNMEEFGQEFLSWVDPNFVRDINENREWYLNHYRENLQNPDHNQILLNIGYPSKQEREFLKHVESALQRKNDDKYVNILKILEAQRQRREQLGSQGDDTEDLKKRYLQTSSGRALGAQEDAQCVICNSGDYEDEDMIVFCGNCNIPVHQSCYGIEQLPEEDWICHNCTVFGLKRGLLLNCILCPKKGGAMKPTNIFASNHFSFRKQAGLQNNSTLCKRNGTTKRMNSTRGGTTEPLSQYDATQEGMQSDSLILIPPTERKFHDLGTNEDKNLSLLSILRREQQYWAELFDRIQELKVKSAKARDTGVPFEIDEGLQSLQKLMQRINEIELNFLPNERDTQIPDDYSFFLQRNETTIDNACQNSQECYVPTQYEWVHLSCATWIPGTTVTPKTPIRLNKLDEKRFQLQCIICLKKQGACMQCQAPRCQIAFHIECARRANYCMEIEKRSDAKDNGTMNLSAASKNDARSSVDKIYRIFCEKHRPLKIVKEMEERDLQTIEEIQRFCKIVDKCMEIDYRHRLKPSSFRNEKRKERERREREKELEKERQKQMELTMKLVQKQALRQSIIADRERRIQEAKEERMRLKMLNRKEKVSKQRPPKPEKPPKQVKVRPISKAMLREIARREREKIKKWREKDKKQLFERVKERYLQYRKLKVSIQRIDPFRKIRMQQSQMNSQAASSKRKRSNKTNNKQSSSMIQLNLAQPQLNNNLSAGNRREGLRQKQQSAGPFTIVIPNFSQSKQQDEIKNIDLENNEEMKENEIQFKLNEESKEVNHEVLNDGCLFNEADSFTAGNVMNEETGIINPNQTILGPDEGIYYKFGNPMYPMDADWTVTLSRNDFPWHEIAFDTFSAKMCYEKYTSIVKDPQTFLKKVLGLKEKYKKMMESQMNIMATGSGAQVENPAVYCRCKGGVVSELFVKCDGEQECPNGSWLHPQCTSDLCDKTKEELDAIEEWYCEDCIARIQREDNDELPESEYNEGAELEAIEEAQDADDVEIELEGDQDEDDVGGQEEQDVDMEEDLDLGDYGDEEEEDIKLLEEEIQNHENQLHKLEAAVAEEDMEVDIELDQEEQAEEDQEERSKSSSNSSLSSRSYCSDGMQQ